MSKSSGKPGSSEVQESIARVVAAMRGECAAPGEAWVMCEGILENYAKNLAAQAKGRDARSFTITPSKLIRENIAAVSYISGKSMEHIICDYLRGIDDRIAYPASLFEDSLSFCQTKKQEQAALERFREYRDANGLDFPDEVIETKLAVEAGRMTQAEAQERIKAFKAAKATGKEVLS